MGEYNLNIENIVSEPSQILPFLSFIIGLLSQLMRFLISPEEIRRITSERKRQLFVDLERNLSNAIEEGTKKLTSEPLEDNNVYNYYLREHFKVHDEFRKFHRLLNLVELNYQILFYSIIFSIILFILSFINMQIFKNIIISIISINLLFQIIIIINLKICKNQFNSIADRIY